MSAPREPNADFLALFWYFVHERHAVYVRRSGGAPAPWTDDEVLRDYFFTNVYRELDPGTQYITEQLERHAGRLPEQVVNAIAYRLALHEDSHAALGWLPAGNEFVRRAGQFRGRLRNLDKPFTPAYVVSNYGRQGAKVDVVMDVLGNIAYTVGTARWGGVLERAPSRAAAMLHLQGLYGIGRFVSFQVLVDLCYPEAEALPWSNDDTAFGGPGCLKGLQILFPGAKQAEDDALLAWLVEAQPHEDMPYINRANMQNCCCEFSKYVRILDGGSARRSFSQREAHFRDKLARGHLRQLELDGL